MKPKINRRKFISNTVTAGIGMSFIPLLSYSQEEIEERKGKFQSPKNKIRIGFIGVGLRGRVHVSNMAKFDGVEIPAICDINYTAINKTQELLNSLGKQKTDIYSESETVYKKLLERDDIDAVVISTPWLWHTRMAVDAMNMAKYVGLEVPAAITLQECWDLVNTYEKTGNPCMILENVCYRRDVLTVLNMVRNGLFGELLHGRCGYQHDLRNIKFDNDLVFGEKGYDEAKWRTYHSLRRNADLYPTHGLGPIAVAMNINRGNRFVFLTSTATKSRGLSKYIDEHPKGGQNHPYSKINWKLGDIVTTTIKTALDETIIVTHDTNLPRPYSLGFRLQGTDGLIEFDYYKKRVHIEGKSESHQWEDFSNYSNKYDSKMWIEESEKAKNSGHGGMDFFIAKAFINAVKLRTEVPLDVYDAAAWSSVTPLSEFSISQGSAPQYFPDFTRGKWMKRKPIFNPNEI